jgi:hypothetical protein
VAGVPCSRASVGDLIRIDQPDCGATLEHRLPDMGNLISAPKAKRKYCGQPSEYVGAHEAGVGFESSFR